MVPAELPLLLSLPKVPRTGAEEIVVELPLVSTSTRMRSMLRWCGLGCILDPRDGGLADIHALVVVDIVEQLGGVLRALVERILTTFQTKVELE